MMVMMMHPLLQLLGEEERGLINSVLALLAALEEKGLRGRVP